MGVSTSVSAAPIIVAEGIRTSFGSNEVHRDVSFSIAPGQIVALIGGSGSGKSVLLRVLMGLLRPSAGTVRVLDTEITSADQQALLLVRRRFGVLFQNGALFSALTVGQNVATPLREYTQLPADLIDQVVKLKLALSGLDEGVALKMPSELSGGMRKRAALARALALEPQLLFLDEPTSGLDPINARAFDKLVRTLCDSLGLTILLVTHDLDTLEGIVDSVIALGDGKVLAQGSVQELRHSAAPWITEYFSSRTRSPE